MSPDQLLDAARRRVRAVLAGRVVVRFAWMAALCALAGVLAARWIAWRPTELLALVVPAAAVVGWANVCHGQRGRPGSCEQGVRTA